MIEILKQFCRKGKFLPEEPWSFENWTYGTDGKILLRVPRIAEVLEIENPPRGTAYIENWLKQEYKYFPIPHVEKHMNLCPHCAGVGKVVDCKECAGSGEAIASTDYNTYEVTCQGCSGDGQLPANDGDIKAYECDQCDGEGKAWERKNINIGGENFANQYLYLLQTLDVKELGVCAEKDSPAHFKLNGHDGLLMPRG